MADVTFVSVKEGVFGAFIQQVEASGGWCIGVPTTCPLPPKRTDWELEFIYEVACFQPSRCSVPFTILDKLPEWHPAQQELEHFRKQGLL